MCGKDLPLITSTEPRTVRKTAAPGFFLYTGDASSFEDATLVGSTVALHRGHVE
jgi:hypothetical protein